MSKICVFERSKDNLPTMEELRVAASRNPNTPVIIKISDTGENFIYKDGVYPLMETSWDEELQPESNDEKKKDNDDS